MVRAGGWVGWVGGVGGWVSGPGGWLAGWPAGGGRGLFLRCWRSRQGNAAARVRKGRGKGRAEERRSRQRAPHGRGALAAAVRGGAWRGLGRARARHSPRHESCAHGANTERCTTEYDGRQRTTTDDDGSRQRRTMRRKWLTADGGRRRRTRPDNDGGRGRRTRTEDEKRRVPSTEGLRKPRSAQPPGRNAPASRRGIAWEHLGSAPKFGTQADGWARGGRREGGGRRAGGGRTAGGLAVRWSGGCGPAARLRNHPHNQHTPT